MRSLRRQLGFLYLTTGANGSGKTLFTLKDVRDLQLATGRPVYYYGFTPKQPIHDFGWLPFEPQNWQELPNGSICIIDECQRPMPVRGTGKPPSWIEMIPEDHRKRGFDFFLITQHPMNMDAFIRRTVASPGWHRHFKASSMGDTSNELKWPFVKDQPQHANSGRDGEVTSRPFPREVYEWYDSASQHTAIKRIPAKVWYAIGLLCLLPLLIGGAFWLHYSQYSKAAKAELVPAEKSKSATEATPGMVSAPSGGSVRGQARESRAMSTSEYYAHYTPRIPDLAYTAPAYDGVTAPTEAPYPAACIATKARCQCYSQQATRLPVSDATCREIAAGGFYVAWRQATPSSSPDRSSTAPLSTFAAGSDGARF